MGAMVTKSTFSKNYNLSKKQGGWTMWSMMFVLSVLFVLAYIGMQLVPIYSSNTNIKNAMRVSLEDKDLSRITRSKVINGMKKQLYLDGASGLIDFKNKFKVARARDEFTVEAEYQREVPLVANLVLVAKFNPKATCTLNGRCEIE